MPKEKRVWPEWWQWELKISAHMQKRFQQRNFTEMDLRRMMEHATGFRKDYIESRFTIDTRFRRKPWEVIVEPLSDEKRLEVITAYERWDDGGQKTR
jgi:hypothetical protein